MTEVTADVVVVAATAEEQAVSAVAVAAVQRARPIAAVRPLTVNFHSVAIARSGQEDAVAVGTGYAVTGYTVKGGPLPGAVVS